MTVPKEIARPPIDWTKLCRELGPGNALNEMFAGRSVCLTKGGVFYESIADGGDIYRTEARTEQSKHTTAILMLPKDSEKPATSFGDVKEVRLLLPGDVSLRGVEPAAIDKAKLKDAAQAAIDTAKRLLQIGLPKDVICRPYFSVEGVVQDEGQKLLLRPDRTKRIDPWGSYTLEEVSQFKLVGDGTNPPVELRPSFQEE
ncbi:MAG: hypothetical protein V1703_01160 [Candidatus Altiarchaeota archaeon]